VTARRPVGRESDGRLTESYVPPDRSFDPMEELFDAESVTVAFDEETLEAIDEKAFRDHQDNREAAVRDLLDEWLKNREE
jgi:hypothetical protein